MSRDEVMDSMYGRALPLPRAPTWGLEAGGGGGGGGDGARAAAAAAARAAGAPLAGSGGPDLTGWAKAAGFEVTPGLGAASASYAWSQSLSHVEVVVRLPRAAAEARWRLASERWRAKAAAAAGEGEAGGSSDDGEEETPRRRKEVGRHVQVHLTATSLRVVITDGGADAARPPMPPGKKGAGGDDGGDAGNGGGGAGENDDESLLAGELEASVKASECTWYIDDDAGAVHLSLLKRCRRGHYDAVPAAVALVGRGAAAAAAGPTAPPPPTPPTPKMPPPPPLRTNADTFWRGLLKDAPASMRMPEGPPPVRYYSCAYEADD